MRTQHADDSKDLRDRFASLSRARVLGTSHFQCIIPVNISLHNIRGQNLVSFGIMVHDPLYFEVGIFWDQPIPRICLKMPECD